MHRVGFGIDSVVYQQICNEVDLIMHLVSDVSLLAPAEQLKEINIEGTQHAIDMAKQTKNKYLLYVSTYAILGNYLYADHAPFTENDFDIGQELATMGYCQTKYDAEKMVKEAEGVNWIVVRPGNIMGDSQTGAYPLLVNKKPSLFYDMFKLVLETGFAPFRAQYYDISPVDYVAQAVVQLSLSHKQVFQVYHATHPQHMRLYQIIQYLSQLYPQIKIIPPEEYANLVKENKLALKNKEDSSLQLLLYQLNPDALLNDESTYVSSLYTVSILEKYGVKAAPLDLDYIRKVSDYAYHVGYIKREDECSSIKTLKKSNYSTHVSNRPQYQELINLNEIESGKPIFWMHPGTGSVDPYYAIAKYIDRPFYGIEPVGWSTDNPPLKDLRSMASFYVRMIRSIQPEGPYDLGGFSLGGLLAYEVSYQLQNIGQQTGPLVMIDTLDNTAFKKMSDLPNDDSALKHAISFVFFSMIATTASNIAPDTLKILFAQLKKTAKRKSNAHKYAQALSALANDFGLVGSQSMIYADIIRKANVMVEFKPFKLATLCDKKSACIYFRVANKVFTPEIFSAFPDELNMPLLNGTYYGKNWKKQFHDFQLVDIEAKSHFEIFNDVGAVAQISTFLRTLYQQEGEGL